MGAGGSFGAEDMVVAENLQPIKRHGGKGAFNGKLARWIISLMPPRDGSWSRFIEPYFGGGSVLLNMDPQGLAEYANDLDGNLMSFWGVLRDDGDELIRRLTLTPLSQDEFDEADDLEEFYTDIDRAVGFFIRNRQSRAAQGKDYVTPTSRLRRGMNEQVSAWLSAVDGLPEVVERMRRVEVWNRPALECIRKLDSPETVFYLDPPYLPDTRHNGGGEYGEHEMTKDDHATLLHDLCFVKGRFLLSGYRNDLYDSVATSYGWTRHDFEIVNNASSKKTKDVKVESVWTNY